MFRPYHQRVVLFVRGVRGPRIPRQSSCFVIWSIPSQTRHKCLTGSANIFIRMSAGLTTPAFSPPRRFMLFNQTLRKRCVNQHVSLCGPRFLHSCLADLLYHHSLLGNSFEFPQNDLVCNPHQTNCVNRLAALYSANHPRGRILIANQCLRHVSYLPRSGRRQCRFIGDIVSCHLFFLKRGRSTRSLEQGAPFQHVKAPSP